MRLRFVFNLLRCLCLIWQGRRFLFCQNKPDFSKNHYLCARFYESEGQRLRP